PPRGIFINQDKYAQEILINHGTTSCDSVGTPMATKHLDANLSGTPVDQAKYRSMVGALMYLTSSRPDIMHATCYCARYQAKPTEKHLTAVKWIFRYLKDTIHMGLWYPKDTDFELTGFLDSDHAGCLDSRKSTSGCIQFLGGDKLVSWSSKKQDCTSMSSAEAEYHFIKELVEKGIVELFFVGTEYQLADLFTKALPEERFKYLARQLGMRCLTPENWRFWQMNLLDLSNIEFDNTGRPYQWVRGSPEEATWEWILDSQSAYSPYHLEGKVNFEGTGNVTPWAADVRRSQTFLASRTIETKENCCVFLRHSLVSWKTRKQDRVSKSSNEAEYRIILTVIITNSPPILTLRLDGMARNSPSEDPMYGEVRFQKTFRMARPLFNEIVTAVIDHGLFFRNNIDCTGKEGISGLLNERTSQKHGFPRMLRSLVYTDWEWFGCPYAFKVQYVKRDHGPNPFILLEAVASQDLWLWHAFFGVVGSNNDIKVLYQSPLFNDPKTGRAPEIPFVANGVTYRSGYYLVDGIYPELAPLVMTIPEPAEDDHKQILYKQKRENRQGKMSKRAFGVLKKKLAILDNPTRALKKK
nr:hypothetical protein [Tanacetum cinerariifolium]